VVLGCAAAGLALTLATGVRAGELTTGAVVLRETEEVACIVTNISNKDNQDLMAELFEDGKSLFGPTVCPQLNPFGGFCFQNVVAGTVPTERLLSCRVTATDVRSARAVIMNLNSGASADAVK
jgi:hypothetical protein